MKKSKFTEEQILGMSRETDRDPVATVAKRQGGSEQAIYTWRKRFGSFQPDAIRRLKQLEQENMRLKKQVVERDLEIEVMKKIAAKNGTRAGPSRAGSVCTTPRPVATTVLHAAKNGAFDAELSIREVGTRCASAGTNGDVVGTASALRLPPHPELP